MYYVLTFVMFQFGTMETDISNWTFKTKSECDKVLESLHKGNKEMYPEEDVATRWQIDKNGIRYSESKSLEFIGITKCVKSELKEPK
jgi:hypothetical protein